ncbi:filamentous hemagglutinin N-terminal domain-containing protein [Halomonas binhaiensis]|uniref:Filamentous hemagglutinin N-terminal domain-containing protein n=1 Tax=Halomonas binhaiensis TaxID=2562282 RepID=A0A856QLZ1_9GAMM|nr:filamentous hemagglutinin N-terminal domain-containing protein [Halomonas binhaiensis]QEM80904.2 filamentous hemagglutinin N-terminal domain-containing protein [Halomonas binhaiensis]
MKLLHHSVSQRLSANAFLCSTSRYWALALTCALTSVLIWHSGAVLAEGIKVAPGSGNTRMDRAGNGVPVVNVATPNGKGVSHNTFRDYNVDRQGLILNNARGKAADTRLGGRISANLNLRDRAAQLIINEVNGGSPSRLKGYTEVAGQRANVVVANPFGITCNGCGFINTPRATLSTGKPVFKDGELDHFAVDQGQVAIEGMGLDATEVDRFDIITRAARLNAEVHANELNVVAGANDVDADSLATTRRTGTGEAPELAVDSSALGGMYAGSIRLVGTEAGVGVKVAGDMAASAGDIRIDANGQLTVANAASTGRVLAKARNATFEGNVHAGEAVELQARDQLKVAGRLTSAGDIDLRAGQHLNNAGQVVAGIENDTLLAGSDLSIQTDQLDNSGRLGATQRLSVRADQTRNAGQMLAQEILIDADQNLSNREGTISSDTIVIDAGRMDNSAAGLVAAEKNLVLDVADTLNNHTGQLQAEEAIVMTAASLNNTAGTVVGDTLALTTRHGLDNGEGMISADGGNLRLQTDGRLDNTAGTIQAPNGGLFLSAHQVDNPGALCRPNASST